jgi:hypothetical protein
MLLVAVMALPCVYWLQGPETAPAVKAAGIEQLCVPSQAAESWRATGIPVRPVTDDELRARETLAAPGLLVQPELASATRSPWLTANGWRFIRNPAGRYLYDLPAGSGLLAASEALAYGADVLLKIGAADLPAVGHLIAQFTELPERDLPNAADIGVVDDNSPEAGELMNLLVRRNLLFRRVDGQNPRDRYPLVVRLGTRDYTRKEAADPSELALKIRRQLTDARRTLRIFGSEVVIARFTADDTRARLHLLNYGGRTLEGLRVRLLGAYRIRQAWAVGFGSVSPTDVTVSGEAIEFSLPSVERYVVVDLDRVAKKREGGE